MMPSLSYVQTTKLDQQQGTTMEALFDSQWVIVVFSALLCVWLLGQGTEYSREDSNHKKYLASLI